MSIMPDASSATNAKRLRQAVASVRRHTTDNNMAIRTIRHRGLRRLWERDDQRAVPAEAAAKLRRMTAAIHRSSAPEKLATAALPG
jgi:hypothetical protein